MKRVIIRSKLSFKALITLFDSLIKPIVLYGAPILAPESTIWSSIINYTESENKFSGNLITSISRSVQEKVHLSFLKWALGVHRKATNVGVWGESGRTPLIYQSIRLSLNYLKRVESLDPSSLVSAALNEQKTLNLPWYNKIKSIIKLDEIYSLDHVSAYRILNPKSKIVKQPLTSNPVTPFNATLMEDMMLHTKKAKPIESKKFRIGKIMAYLTDHFKKNWEHQKSTSSKLSFYHSIKSKFGREPYLETCKGFSRRYCTTQLRISAHDLQIERGRYSNTPRENRICTWCQTSMGISKIEDESHVLYECDLYAKYRSKLITNLNKTPVLEDCEHIQVTPSLGITTSNLKSTLMPILTPNCTEYCDPQNINFHPHIHICQASEIKPNTPAFTSLLRRRSYAINCVCTYVFKCSEERKTFFESAKKSMIDERRFNKVTINLLRAT